MSPRNTLIVALTVLAACATSTEVNRATPHQASAHRGVPESRDLDGGLTVAEQSLAPDDVELRETIRDALLADPYLSTTAKSVNIVSNEKHVTLRGFVASETERKRVAGYAAEIAGGSEQVDNLLQVPAAQ